MAMRNLSARTKYSNTPESDMQAEVMHIVEWTDENGEKRSMELMATDPMDAINAAREMLRNFAVDGV